MLKILEEPPLGTYIFINLESLGGLLATFVSRIRILDTFPTLEKIGKPTENISSKFFLNGGIKEKLAIIRSLSKKNPSADGKSEMKELIRNLEEIAYKNNLKAENLKNILTAKIFAGARGASPKMLLGMAVLRAIIHLCLISWN